MITVLAVIAFFMTVDIVEEKGQMSYAKACMIVFAFPSFVVSPIVCILPLLFNLL